MVLYKVAKEFGNSTSAIPESVFYTLKEARKRKKERGAGYAIFKLVPTEFSKHMSSSKRVYYYKKVK
jgi:hypothetical protein